MYHTAIFKTIICSWCINILSSSFRVDLSERNLTSLKFKLPPDLVFHVHDQIVFK